MIPLHQLRAHFPALLIDAASSEIQVGVLESTGTIRWQVSRDEAGVAVFECVRTLGVDLREICSFVFCDGPGSILGIRTVAMALRTWHVLQARPLFAYCSLAVVAHAFGRSDVAVIADARRDTWHHYRIGEGLRRVASADLQGELVMPENFRHWSSPPANVRRVPYSLATLVPTLWDADLLRATDSPDAFLQEEPSYVTWSPQVHQAPAPR